MWIVVVTGAFGVLTLLVKAAIDVGRKKTRWRRDLTLDVDLLGKLREAHPKSTSIWDLEERIDRQLLEYSWLGTKPPSASPQQEVEAASRRRSRFIAQAGSSVIAVGSALVAGVLANWVVEGLASTDPTIDFEGALPVALGVLGVVSALAGLALATRTLRPSSVVVKFEGDRRRKPAEHPSASPNSSTE